MATVTDIFQYIDQKAPFSLQESFDNAGFLVGRGDATVTKLTVSLDITEEVVSEAADLGAQLIVSHHPVLFHPAKTLTDGDPVGRCVLALTENRIAAICAHTNLDAVEGGVNDALARALGLSDVELLRREGSDPYGRPYGIGRIGTVAGFAGAGEFAVFVRDALDAQGLRLEDAERAVRRVAVAGGACGDMLYEAVAAGCDTFVTADVKYHQFLDAHALGLNLIDAGHFSTENVICPVLENWLRTGFPRVEVYRARRHREVFFCI